MKTLLLVISLCLISSYCFAGDDEGKVYTNEDLKESAGNSKTAADMIKEIREKDDKESEKRQEQERQDILRKYDQIKLQEIQKQKSPPRRPQIDPTCLGDCMNRGSLYQYCKEHCAY
jgi:hypothetical protein